MCLYSYCHVLPFKSMRAGVKNLTSIVKTEVG